MFVVIEKCADGFVLLKLIISGVCLYVSIGVVQALRFASTVELYQRF